MVGARKEWEGEGGARVREGGRREKDIGGECGGAVVDGLIGEEIGAADSVGAGEMRRWERERASESEVFFLLVCGRCGLRKSRKSHQVWLYAPRAKVPGSI